MMVMTGLATLALILALCRLTRNISHRHLTQIFNCPPRQGGPSLLVIYLLPQNTKVAAMVLYSSNTPHSYYQIN